MWPARSVSRERRYPRSLLEFRNGFTFLRVPVIADWQTKNTSALHRIPAQDRRTVETVVSLPVNLQVLLQLLILLRIGQVHPFRSQIE